MMVLPSYEGVCMLQQPAVDDTDTTTLPAELFVLDVPTWCIDDSNCTSNRFVKIDQIECGLIPCVAAVLI